MTVAVAPGVMVQDFDPNVQYCFRVFIPVARLEQKSKRTLKAGPESTTGSSHSLNAVKCDLWMVQSSRRVPLPGFKSLLVAQDAYHTRTRMKMSRHSLPHSCS